MLFLFFNRPAPTAIYTLSLHDALPIYTRTCQCPPAPPSRTPSRAAAPGLAVARSEEHTSELQSPCNLVCRLLLEKKKIMNKPYRHQKKNTYKYTKTNKRTVPRNSLSAS